MALPKRVLSLIHRVLCGYGRHDAHLDGRFFVPIHRTDAELRDLCNGGCAVIKNAVIESVTITSENHGVLDA